MQRVPATEASGRVHTSTATVAIMPEVDEVDVVIEAKVGWRGRGASVRAGAGLGVCEGPVGGEVGQGFGVRRCAACGVCVGGVVLGQLVHLLEQWPGCLSRSPAPCKVACEPADPVG